MDKTFNKGSNIYTAGEDSHSVYLVREGTVIIEKDCDVLRKNQWPLGSKKWEICNTAVRYRKRTRLAKAYDIFGSNEVIKNERRHTHAVAKTKVVVFVINREEFMDNMTK